MGAGGSGVLQLLDVLFSCWPGSNCVLIISGCRLVFLGVPYSKSGPRFSHHDDDFLFSFRDPWTLLLPPSQEFNLIG